MKTMLRDLALPASKGRSGPLCDSVLARTATAFRGMSTARLIVLMALMAAGALGSDCGLLQAQARTLPPRADRQNHWSSNGPIGGEVRVLAVDPSNSLNVYAGTAQGVMKSTDAGVTWRAANIGMGKRVVTSVVIEGIAESRSQHRRRP